LQPEPRRPGRPRSARADTAILEATLELLAERGLTALTIEGVAARAGVGKATVYRRWASKNDLVRAAITRIGTQDMRLPDTGSVRGDVVAMMRGRRESASATRAGFFIPRLVGEAAGDPELGPLLDEVLVQPGRRVMRAILERGVERGELRSDLDLESAVDLLVGAIVYRLLYSGGDLSLLEQLPERHLAAALAGLAAEPRPTRVSPDDPREGQPSTGRQGG
jgi:AcrR family transcriptional regulator